MKTLQRAFRATIFDRKVHRELFFDSDATADAVLLVAAISTVVYAGLVARIGLSNFAVTGLFEVIIGGLVGWLILAAGTWVAATKLFHGSGQLQTMMRLHGHCELPLLLTIFGSFGAAAGLLLSAAAKVPATSEAASLDTIKSVAAVLVGFALVVIFQLLFRLPFMALGSLF